MLGIMAGLEQMDSYALFPGSAMYKAGFAGDIAPRAVLSSQVCRPTMLGIMAGMVQMDSYALGSGMYKAGIAGGNASRAVFAGMRGSLFGALCIGTGPGRSCPQGHDLHN